MDVKSGSNLKIGIVGLGLMGGSLAKTIRRIHPDSQIVACDTSLESLKLAMLESTIDNYCLNNINIVFKNCNYIFLCAPVSVNSSCLDELKTWLDDDTLLTDIGSVKAPIHNSIEKKGLKKYFIGGHPMIGAEKSGYANSSAYMLENAYYVITTFLDTPEKKVRQYEEFIKGLSAIPIILDYTEHDYIVGMISHLPHIIAAGLVNYVREADEDEIMKTLAAGGFKDITRIASSSPVMWEQICLENSGNIVRLMDGFIELLKGIKESITSHDNSGINRFFSDSKDYRDSLPLRQGAIGKVYELFCDIIDRPGEIAAVAGLLAKQDISIRNIGIINNREFVNGVLRIEFKMPQELETAKAVLIENNYTIYEN